MAKVIITCALTGAQQGKEANPNLPEQPEEIIAQGVDAWRAGASILHIHARDAQGKATADVSVFRRIVEGIRGEGCDALLNLTTGRSGCPVCPSKNAFAWYLSCTRTSHPLVWGVGCLLGRYDKRPRAVVQRPLCTLIFLSPGIGKGRSCLPGKWGSSRDRDLPRRHAQQLGFFAGTRCVRRADADQLCHGNPWGVHRGDGPRTSYFW